MYKATIELVKVNKTMKLKFNVILYSPDDEKKFNSKLISRTVNNDMETLKFNPHPYVTIDISPSTREWNTAYTVNLNQMAIFMARKAIRRAIDNLRTEDLFVFIDDKLTLDKGLADDLTEKFISSNKHILLRPIVIEDELDGYSEYEGICFMINTIHNHCLLTIDEAEFLCDYLEKLDLIALSLKMIDLSSIDENHIQLNLDEERIRRSFAEQTQDEDVKSNFSTKPPKSQLPDLN